MGENEKVIRAGSYETDLIPKVYIIEKEGVKTKVIQKVISQGYNGSIELLFGISISGENLSDITVLNHNETADYGGYLTEEWFLERFIDRDVRRQLELVKIINKKPEEVVAITGATITSRGVVDGANRAFKNYLKIMEEYQDEKN